MAKRKDDITISDEQSTVTYYNKTHDFSVLPEFNMKEFGQRMKRARKRIGMSQKNLAELLSVDKTTISNYETGRRSDINPSIETVYYIASILGVSIDWLCGLSLISNIKTISKEDYRVLYIKTVVNLMRKAGSEGKETKKYYKFPKRGPVFELKEELDELEYKFAAFDYSSKRYSEEKEKIWYVFWQKIENAIVDDTHHDIEYFMLEGLEDEDIYIKEAMSFEFKEKDYNKYSSRKAKERKELYDNIDEMDLPF